MQICNGEFDVNVILLRQLYAYQKARQQKEFVEVQTHFTLSQNLQKKTELLM